MTTFDLDLLQKFCSTQADEREYLRQPFRTPFGIIRTNGHVLICLPDDGGEYGTHDKIDKSLAKYSAEATSPDGDWISMDAIALPEKQICQECKGTGISNVMDCDDCEGEGEFRHGDHRYECKECDGNGTVRCAPTEGSPSKCDACDGTGETVLPVHVGDSAYMRKYLAMFQSLPGSKLRTKKHEMASVQFDGGWGCIMPYKVYP